MPSLRKRLLLALTGAVLALLLTGSVYAYEEVLTPEARAIALNIQCPVCPGESIAESNADVARNMRIRVQEMMDEGRSEQEILDYFVESFGIGILRDPPKAGIALGVWVVPPLALLAGLGLLYRVFRSWRRHSLRAVQEEAPGAVYETRVEEELRRWEERA